MKVLEINNMEREMVIFVYDNVKNVLAFNELQLR